ncbi:hypothetical protein [Streptomyces sp. NPDC059819]|uniref:hypothetical protein n=1 Tax=Streptomyces sp. NPDC059819 TaxID=3346963 RepID=UPI00365A090F
MIAAGLDHSLARGEDGTVWAWGYNVNCQLGEGTPATGNIPMQVNALRGVDKIAAPIGGDFNLAN